ncbi:DEAD/DEAH box helicase [Vibrio chagasii]|nr:DEAD/DEAH box helicase [Vibrio chagasii]
MYGQRAVHFDEVEGLVLDEADRMLDMYFIEDTSTKIIARLPRCANPLFSATCHFTPVRTSEERYQ